MTIYSYTCDFINKRMNKDSYVHHVNGILQRERKEAHEFIDRQIQDKVIRVADPEFFKKIYPVMVQTALNPKGRKKLEELVTLLKVKKESLHVKEAQEKTGDFTESILEGMGIMKGSHGALQSDFLGGHQLVIGVCMSNAEKGTFEQVNWSWNPAKSDFEDTGKLWTEKPLGAQRIFEHESQHIIQILKGTVEKLKNSGKCACWTNDAEREAIEVENDLAEGRGDTSKRITHRLTPNVQVNTKKDRFLVALANCDEVTVKKMLDEWVRRGELMVILEASERVMNEGIEKELQSNPQIRLMVHALGNTFLSEMKAKLVSSLREPFADKIKALQGDCGSVEEMFNLLEIDTKIFFSLCTERVALGASEADQKLSAEYQKRFRSIFDLVLGALASTGHYDKARTLLAEVDAFFEKQRVTYEPTVAELRKVSEQIEALRKVCKIDEPPPPPLSKEESLRIVLERANLHLPKT